MDEFSRQIPYILGGYGLSLVLLFSLVVIMVRRRQKIKRESQILDVLQKNKAHMEQKNDKKDEGLS